MSEENKLCKKCKEVIPTKYFKTHLLNCEGVSHDHEAILLDNIHINKESVKKFKKERKKKNG